MKKYTTILFDLDGTLTDPSHGLVESYYYGLTKMGVKIEDKAALTKYIGPTLLDIWQTDYAFTPEESAEAVSRFREYFSVYGWWDNKVYPGVHKMLEKLKNSGKTLILATSKPEVFARKIIDLFDLTKYFDFIGAASLDSSRDKKSQVIDYALDSLGLKSRSECILVGDRKYDAEGARLCGIDSIGVLYGMGSEAELRSAGFTRLAKTVNDVLASLL